MRRGLRLWSLVSILTMRLGCRRSWLPCWAKRETYPSRVVLQPQQLLHVTLKISNGATIFSFSLLCPRSTQSTPQIPFLCVLAVFLEAPLPHRRLPFWMGAFSSRLFPFSR